MQKKLFPKNIQHVTLFFTAEERAKELQRISEFAGDSAYEVPMNDIARVIAMERQDGQELLDAYAERMAPVLKEAADKYALSWAVLEQYIDSNCLMPKQLENKNLTPNLLFKNQRLFQESLFTSKEFLEFMESQKEYEHLQKKYDYNMEHYRYEDENGDTHLAMNYVIAASLMAYNNTTIGKEMRNAFSGTYNDADFENYKSEFLNYAMTDKTGIKSFTNYRGAEGNTGKFIPGEKAKNGALNTYFSTTFQEITRRIVDQETHSNSYARKTKKWVVNSIDAMKENAKDNGGAELELSAEHTTEDIVLQKINASDADIKFAMTGIDQHDEKQVISTSEKQGFAIMQKFMGGLHEWPDDLKEDLTAKLDER